MGFPRVTVALVAVTVALVAGVIGHRAQSL
jgi:hypothetical protein